MALEANEPRPVRSLDGIALRSRARELRGALYDGEVELVAVVREARELFDALGHPAVVNWLDLELKGYSTVESQKPLSAVLQLRSDDQLVRFVAGYRTHVGSALDDAGALMHFFVEPIGEIQEAHGQVSRTGRRDRVRLDFADGSRSGLFSADVFHRIALGLRATLHLQLGGVR
jgi:hypothetical protein